MATWSSVWAPRPSSGRSVAPGADELAAAEEEIVTNDPALRRLQYRIEEGMPVDFHVATVDVLEDRDGALVIYGDDLEPDELPGRNGPAFESGLEGLKSHLEL